MFNLNLDEVKTYDYHQIGLPSTIEGATYALDGRDYEYFGNNFGNKDVVFLQTHVLPIDLAETRGFEPPIHVLAQMLP